MLNRELLALLLDLQKRVRELVVTKQVLEAGGKAVSRLSKLVRVAADCVEESKTEEPDNEIEMRREEVFLQGG